MRDQVDHSEPTKQMLFTKTMQMMREEASQVGLALDDVIEMD